MSKRVIFNRFAFETSFAFIYTFNRHFFYCLVHIQKMLSTHSVQFRSQRAECASKIFVAELTHTYAQATIVPTRTHTQSFFAPHKYTNRIHYYTTYPSIFWRVSTTRSASLNNTYTHAFEHYQRKGYHIHTERCSVPIFMNKIHWNVGLDMKW